MIRSALLFIQYMCGNIPLCICTVKWGIPCTHTISGETIACLTSQTFIVHHHIGGVFLIPAAIYMRELRPRRALSLAAAVLINIAGVIRLRDDTVATGWYTAASLFRCADETRCRATAVGFGREENTIYSDAFASLALYLYFLLVEGRIASYGLTWTN